MTTPTELSEGCLSDWDYFKCHIDKQPPVDEKHCLVCSQKMEVQRSCHTPWRKYSGGPYNYDLFVCPNAHQVYHKQALCLKLQIFMESSQLVSELYEKELASILLNKKESINNKKWDRYISALSLRYLSYQH